MSVDSLSQLSVEDQFKSLNESVDLLIAMQEERDRQSRNDFKALLGRLDQLEEQLANVSVSASEPQKKSESESEESTKWESQKQSVMQKYGLLQDTADDEPSLEQEIEIPCEPVVATPPKNTDPVVIVEIDELRRQLHDQMRSAEIELSIKRAKLIQEQSELEERLAQLERRERMVSKQAEQACPKKQGILARMSRHLGNGKSGSKDNH